jgi:hypothetical protein
LKVSNNIIGVCQVQERKEEMKECEEKEKGGEKKSTY